MIRLLADTIVDWEALGRVALYSLMAGVGVPAIWALSVHGATRSTDPDRERGSLVAVLYVIVAVIAALVCLAAFAYGLYLMTQKD